MRFFPRLLQRRKSPELLARRSAGMSSRWLSRVLTPFVLAVTICGLFDSNLGDGWGFSSLEFQSYAARAKWRRQVHPVGKSGQPIVLVTLTDQTFSDAKFAHLHGPPVPRDYHARILRTLTEAGAKVVAFDLIFDIPRREDFALASATRESSRVAWACLLDESDRLVSPSNQLLRASRNLGHIEVPHHDNIPAVHRILPFLEYSQIHPEARENSELVPARVPALSLQIARMAMGLENSDVQRHAGAWQIGDFRLPLDKDGYFLIDYQGAPDAVFPTVPYEDLYAAKDSAEAAAFYKNFFRNKIVIVGDTSKIGNDLVYTPLGTMWGVEAQAHAVASLLQHRFIADVPPWLNLLIIGGLAAVVCLAARLRRLRHFVLMSFAFSAGYFAFTVWVFVQHAIALHLVAPMSALIITMVGILIQRGLAEEREKDLMFDSLVSAAASAIEARDPSTSGHSLRVTQLTVELAKAVSQCKEGPFKAICFTNSQLRELNYAGMLHDFGKIGVRENILTKSHKLEPAHFQTVKARLLLQRRSLQHNAVLLKLDALLDIQKQGNTVSEETWQAFRLLDERLNSEVNELDDNMAFLERANDPFVTFLPDAEFNELSALLDRLETMNYEDETGEIKPLLTAAEKEALKVRKGSLTADEYKQVQQHAEMSYHFLSQIPWTEDLSNIPEIARSHHEKLNGSGYPLGIMAKDIPIETRMMTIADIYDALTAADRPYKKAMPAEKALSILRSEAESGTLDMDLLNLFIEQEVYMVTQEKPATETVLQTSEIVTQPTPMYQNS
ncbi:MAG TPA: CHASE2 domain-containing protein [Abditibacteriaceae bacterium]|jgi:HD-GYP domain-containing protein (c-di-GMP phosphodiesterase class II)